MGTIEFNHFSEKSLKSWVFGFIGIHIILWTLAPMIVRLCLPMDALEGTTWGQQLEWGYDKNPFMNAWLTALAVKISQPRDWAIYLFSQLSVGLSFWSVWALGKRITAPIYALMAILVLGSIQYYNLHAIDFNDNTLELGLWGLSVLYFYKSLRDNRLLDWILLGIFTSLSLMTKYFVVTLLFPMFLFMIFFPQTRQLFKKPFFYICLLVFTIVSLPHFVWLFHNDFITINYAFNRVSAEPHFSNHLFYPLQFLWQQFEVFVPAFVLLSLLWIGNKKPTQDQCPVYFDKMFLLFMAIGPILTTSLLSAFTGMKLRAGWGQPLLTFLPLFFLVWFIPHLTTRRLKTFISISGSVMLAMLAGYCIAIIKADSPSSANFPGKIISRSLEQEWHDQFGAPLKYVVGARWIAGNVSFYSHDKPSVFIDGNNHISPWINEKDLKKNGAIFVWDPTEQHQMTMDEIKQRYPRLGTIKVLHYSWLRNATMKPIEISVAMLPPEPV